MLQLIHAGVFGLLPLDGHANNIEQLGLVGGYPQPLTAGCEALPPVHLDLLHGFKGSLVDGVPVVGLPQDVSQRDFGVAKEAHLEVAVAGDAQAVAGAAEVVRHAGDEADAAGVARHAPGLAGVVAVVSHLLQARVLLADEVEHLRVAVHFPAAPLVAVKGHVLDEADLNVLVAGHFDEWHNLAVVDATHDDAVDFEPDAGAETVELEDPVYAPLHGVEAFPAGHNLELKGVEGVEAEVDAGEPGLDHGVELAVEGDAVGGEADLLEAVGAEGAELLHQGEYVPAHGGLAAGESDLGDALGDEDGGEHDNLRGGEELVVGGERHALLGHAVDAAEVAPLRDRDAQVVMLAVEGVCEEVGEGFGIRD